MKTTSNKNSVKASVAKPLCKPIPRDKTLGLDLVIWEYMLEDGDDNAEVEEAETLFIHDSSLAVYNQNLVKRKFPYINMFNHEVSVVVNAMRDLTSGVFVHLYIASPMYVDQRVV